MTLQEAMQNGNAAKIETWHDGPYIYKRDDGVWAWGLDGSKFNPTEKWAKATNWINVPRPAETADKFVNREITVFINVQNDGSIAAFRTRAQAAAAADANTKRIAVPLTGEVKV